MATITLNQRRAIDNLPGAEEVKPDAKTDAGAAAQPRGLPDVKDQFEPQRPAMLDSPVTAGTPMKLPDPVPAPSVKVADLLLGKGFPGAGAGDGMKPSAGPRPGLQPMAMGLAFPGIAPKADQDVPPGSPPDDPDPIPEPDPDRRFTADGIGPRPGGPSPGPAPIAADLAFQGIAPKADQDVPPGSPPDDPDPIPEPDPDTRFAGLTAGIGLRAQQDVPPSPPEPEPQPEPPNPEPGINAAMRKLLK